MILFLLPILSLTAAKVYPRTGANEVLDGVDGVLYDIPDYEDPELVLFKLLARGIMPVFTQLSALKHIANEKDDKHYYETDDIKEELAGVMTLLQAVKSKLEKGNNQVIKDIIQSINYLESLKQRLQVDDHTLDTSLTNLSTPDTVVEHSSTAATFTEVFSPLAISVRRQYLLSDDPFYRYFALEPPVNEPPTSDSSAQQQISPEAPLVLHVAPDVSSTDEPSVPDESVEIVLSLLDESSEASVQPLSSTASTANPSDGAAFSAHVSSAVEPVVKFVDHNEQMETQQEGDVYISKTEKKELGTKGTAIYKKMTWRSTNLL